MPWPTTPPGAPCGRWAPTSTTWGPRPSRRRWPWPTGTAATALPAAAGHRPNRCSAGWIRRCPADGSEHYPRTDMAVIMAVVDADDRMLLARGKGFRGNGMSVLAGFVEPGESLAAAVAREVARGGGGRGHRGDVPRRPALAVPVIAHARLHGPRPGHRPAAPARRDRGGPVVLPRRADRGTGRRVGASCPGASRSPGGSSSTGSGARSTHPRSRCADRPPHPRAGC